MLDFRASGVLLHPTSLPSRFGIGDLGENAYRFVDFLAKSYQQIWQILPIGPTGYGNSPYLSYSALAGNPLLISPAILQSQGWLTEEDFDDFLKKFLVVIIFLVEEVLFVFLFSS